MRTRPAREEEGELRIGRSHHLARVLIVLCVLILPAFLSLGCGGDDEGGTDTVLRHPEDFLPPGTEGMPENGNPSTATDADGLREIVNGGWQIYTNNGFREMVEQLYSGTVGGTSATIQVWIMDVETSENAASLQEELTAESTWENAGVIGDEDHRLTSLFAYTILFRREGYSVQVEISTGTQDSKDLAVLFATHIDGEITRS
ncbi:MAG: hypothetical protein ABIH26_02440 [Candidatus Eisenbacteria bacterium]